MRKFILIIISFFIFDFAVALPVGFQKARQIAGKVLGENTLKSTSVLEMKYAAVNDSDTLFYIFANPDGGFAIISADDAVMPVLGYSLTSKAGEVAANKSFAGQLSRYSKIISLQKKNKVRSRRTLNAWRLFAEADSVVIDSIPVDSVSVDSIPVDTIAIDTISVDTVAVTDTVMKPIQLMTSMWGQENPYNDSCPSYVGCVATAVGQIMHYHKWPQTGRGWHKYIPNENPEYGTQYANFGATTYDWDRMPDRLRSRSSIAEKRAVQQLLYHVGVAINMSYTKDGSGSYDFDVPMALSAYFKYNHETIKICFEADYTADEWIALIKSEIDAGRPVLYTGCDKDDEGHAWVVDGYDADNYLHVNWGWDGDYDGYFASNNMLLGTLSYNLDISAVVGIQPSTDVPLLWTKQSSAFASDFRGITNISAVDRYTVWASAHDGASGGQCMDFCRTTDGGESWEGKTIKISGYKNYSISMISAVSANEAWAAVFVSINSRTLKGGKILHTTDGGDSWEIQPTAAFSGSKAFPNIVHFWDARNGVCIGDPNGGYFEIYTTTDGGENWSRVPSSNIPANKSDEQGVVAYYSVVGDNIFFSTTKGRLYRSVDRGATWTVAQTPLKNIFILAFRNANTGVIKGGDDDKFLAYQTFDGGSSWNELGVQDNFYPSDVAYIPNSDTLVSVGGYNGRDVSYCGLSYSVDDGCTFTDFANFYKDVGSYTAVGFSPDGKGAWVGSYGFGKYYGGMYHRGEIKHIKRNSDVVEYLEVAEKPISVYPNPATGFITVAGVRKGCIMIFDALGHLVLQVSDYVEGSRVDVLHLSSGLYVLRVLTSEASTAVQLVIN